MGVRLTIINFKVKKCYKLNTHYPLFLDKDLSDFRLEFNGGYELMMLDVD